MRDGHATAILGIAAIRAKMDVVPTSDEQASVQADHNDEPSAPSDGQFQDPNSTTPERLPTVPRAPLVARLAVLLAVFGCLAGLVWALSLGAETPRPDDVAIERLTPPPASEAVPGQTPIIIDLAFGYDLELFIDGTPIPREQVVEVDSTGQFTFTPGEGKFTERFTNGKHVAQIVYWPKTGERAKESSLYQWTFNVV